MITKVTGKNIKGRDFDYDLAPITIITGDNYSGKSAIFESIRLAISGYSPDVNKTNTGIWEMAGEGREMAVAVETTGGKYNRRYWSERGSIKSDGTDPRKIVALDPDIYFSLSAAKRVEYILANAKIPDRFNTDSIVAGLEKTSLGENHSEEAEDYKRQLINTVRDTLDEAPNPSEGLEAVVSDLRESLKETNARLKGAKEAMRALVSMKHGDEVSGTPESAREAMAKIQKELDFTKEKRRTIEKAVKDYKQGVERRKSIKEALAAPGKDYGTEEKAVKEKLNALNPEEEIDTTKLEEEIKDARAKAQAFLLAYESKKSELDRVSQEITELDFEESCPHCGSAGEGWKARLKAKLVAEKNAIKVPDYNEFERMAVKAKNLEGDLLSSKAANETIRTNNDEIKRLQEQLETLAENKAADEARRKELQSKLSESEPQKPDDSGLDSLTGKIQELESRLETAQETEREAVRHQQDRKRAAEAEATVTKCETEAKVMKLFGASLSEKRQELAQEVLTPIIQTANTVAGCILKTPLEYRDGEIGRQQGGTWISHRTFSGAEKAVTYAAVSVALSGQGYFRVLMLDELSRLTPALQSRFLEGVSEAISKGMLEQAILISPVPVKVPAGVEALEIVVENAEEQRQ